MKKFVGIILLVAGTALSCVGQDLLSKNITLEVSRQRLDDVLAILSNKGDFYFSYNSKIVKKDSLVTLSARNKTLKEVLDLLFNNTHEFKQSGNYVIIREGADQDDHGYPKSRLKKIYSVSGHVFDEQSGVAVNEASVYEKSNWYLH
jgi:hypothetical protein